MRAENHFAETLERVQLVRGMSVASYNCRKQARAGLTFKCSSRNRPHMNRAIAILCAGPTTFGFRAHDATRGYVSCYRVLSEAFWKSSASTMSAQTEPRIPLPKSWNKHVRSSLLHVISLPPFEIQTAVSYISITYCTAVFARVRSAVVAARSFGTPNALIPATAANLFADGVAHCGEGLPHISGDTPF